MSVDAEQERLRFEGDLDKWMKMLGAGITGYQPEAYAVMDAAIEELVKLRGKKKPDVRPEDLGDHNVLLEDHLRAAITDELAGVEPRIVLGDDDSIFLTERQEGYKEGLNFVLALLGASHSTSIPT